MHLKILPTKCWPFCWDLKVLTHCDLVMVYGVIKLKSTLVLEMAYCLTAPSHHPNQSLRLCSFQLSVISQEILKIYTLDTSLKNDVISIQPCLPGVNELICFLSIDESQFNRVNLLLNIRNRHHKFKVWPSEWCHMNVIASYITSHSLNCLFKSLSRLTTKKHQCSALLAFCTENPQ